MRDSSDDARTAARALSTLLLQSEPTTGSGPALDRCLVNGLASTASQEVEPVNLAAAFHVEAAHPVDATTAARRRTRWHAPIIDAISEREVDAFVDWRYANNLAPTTIRNDRAQLVGLVGALGGVDSLTPGGLRRLAELREYKQSTHSGYHKICARFTRWRVEQGRATVDPFAGIKPPARGEVEPNPCTTHERDVLVALAPEPVRSYLILAAQGEGSQSRLGCRAPVRRRAARRPTARPPL
jgi:hypothetical protein